MKSELPSRPFFRRKKTTITPGCARFLFRVDVERTFGFGASGMPLICTIPQLTLPLPPRIPKGCLAFVFERKQCQAENRPIEPDTGNAGAGIYTLPPLPNYSFLSF